MIHNRIDYCPFCSANSFGCQYFCLHLLLCLSHGLFVATTWGICRWYRPWVPCPTAYRLYLCPSHARGCTLWFVTRLFLASQDCCWSSILYPLSVFLLSKFSTFLRITLQDLWGPSQELLLTVAYHQHQVPAVSGTAPLPILVNLQVLIQLTLEYLGLALLEQALRFAVV